MIKYILPVTIVLLILAVVFLNRDKIHSIPETLVQTNKVTPSVSPQPTSAQSKDQVSAGKNPDIHFNLPPGFTIHLFASGLGDPRDLQFSQGGTLLVSIPSANVVVALPDKNGDGVADSKEVVIRNLNHVHGLGFYNGKLFVAGVTQLDRFNWDENSQTTVLDRVLFSLPNNNDHNNRTLTFDQNGRMFLSLGSTCNVCTQSPLQGGSVLVSDADGTTPQVFASGLRNTAFLQINPQTGELWGTEMGRDYLGDHLPPDELNIIKQDQNYGWPQCFGDKIPDTNFNPSSNNGTCANTQSPIYQFPAHNAPLGLVFINSSQLPSDWQGDLLVALHGSWNSSVPVGYKVVHLKVSGNTITGSEDFLTGFFAGK